MTPNQPQKKLKSIPDFIREDAPFGRNKVYEFIRDGVLKTVRIGPRQYIVMESFNRLATPAAE
jgi:hypothetical protein